MSKHRAAAAPRAPLLKMADYERIHSVARSVLDATHSHTFEGCVFFSLAGAYLLQKHHKLDAIPVAGAAFYCLDGEPKPSALTFARFGELDVVSDLKSFHCWVDVDGWVIDFMAPIFHENAAKQGLPLTIPRRMFQRHVSTMAASWDEMGQAGDFHLIPNAPLSAQVFQGAVRPPATGDLIDICSRWYRPTPKKIDTQTAMASNDGTVQAVDLRSTSLVGAW